MLILFARPLALSPKRPGRLLLLPVLNAEDDFDLTLSLLLEAALTDEEGGGLAAEADAVDNLPAMTFLGLFCPVLLLLLLLVLLVVAPDCLSALARRDETEGSDGSLDIIGGLGGRADVNF